MIRIDEQHGNEGQDGRCSHASHDRLRASLAAFTAGTFGRYEAGGALWGQCARCTSTIAIQTTNGEEMGHGR